MRKGIAVAVFLFAARARAGDVTIGVRGDEGDLQIAVQERDHVGWATLCKTPCTTKGPSDGMYRLGGFAVQPSRKLTLPKGEDVVELKAHVTTTHDRRIGTQMTIGGAVVAGLGVAGVLVGFIWAFTLWGNHCSPNLFEGCQPYDATGPAVSAAAGAIVAAFGALLLASGLETRAASKLTVVARAPESVNFREARGWPRPQSFPIFEVTF